MAAFPHMAFQGVGGRSSSGARPLSPVGNTGMYPTSSQAIRSRQELDEIHRQALFAGLAKQYPEDPSDPTGRRLLPPQQSGSINITPAYGVGYGQSLGEMPIFEANGGRTTALRAALPFLNHYQTEGLAPRPLVDMEARAQAAMSRAPVDAQFAMGGNSMNRLTALNQMRQAGLMPQGGGQMAASPSMPLQSSGAPQIPIVPGQYAIPSARQNISQGADGATYINPEGIQRSGFQVDNRNTASTNIDPATGRPRQLFVDIVDGRARLRPREDGPSDGSYTQPDGTVVSADEMSARRRDAIQNRRQRAADSLAARQRAMGVRPLQSNPVGSVASRGGGSKPPASLYDQAFARGPGRPKSKTPSQVVNDRLQAESYAGVTAMNGMSAEDTDQFRAIEALAANATPDDFVAAYRSPELNGGQEKSESDVYADFLRLSSVHKRASEKAAHGEYGKSKEEGQKAAKEEHDRREAALKALLMSMPEPVRERAKKDAEDQYRKEVDRRKEASPSSWYDGSYTGAWQ